MKDNSGDRVVFPIIVLLSVAIPIAVAFLLFSDFSMEVFTDVSFLPALNATLNSGVTVALILGVIFVKQKKIRLHQSMMLSALILSAIFLVSYVIYHSSGVGSVRYNGEGMMRIIYLFILLTHIVLSVVIVPLALLSVYRGWTNKIEKHRKIAKWTFPIWLYVAITGVVVYLMAHQFNPIVE